MTKYDIGNGYDKSHIEVNFTTTGDSNLHVSQGDLYDEASADIHINDQGHSASPASPDDRRASAPLPRPEVFWHGIARAAMILVGLVITLTALAVASSIVTAWALPIVIVAALLGAYLLALVIMPGNERAELTGFGGVLSTFVKAALRPADKSKE